MYVDFEFSGGYVFLRSSFHENTDRMNPESSKKLIELIKNSGIMNLNQNDILPSTEKAVDLFNYKIFISDKGTNVSLSFDDLSVPEKIRPLLEYLKELAIKQKTKP